MLPGLPLAEAEAEPACPPRCAGARRDAGGGKAYGIGWCARMLGLTIPPWLLVRADQLIEVP